MRKLFLIIILAVSVNIFAQEIKPVRNIDDLEAIRKSSSGKVTLYNFWATWCKPCVQEFPELVKLYADYKDKGFELVFISVDMPEQVQDKVAPFLKNQNVSFTTYYNDFKSIDDFINYYDKEWEGAIPSTYIYDKDGKLAQKFIGNKDYDFFEKEIKKYLN
ncbi:MAG: TlpA disulfide reductase family protein [Ignavibacteria bacterium]|nr:TlpA disulfide reductase family protein [Ignavibacteria bacterium]